MGSSSVVLGSSDEVSGCSLEVGGGDGGDGGDGVDGIGAGEGVRSDAGSRESGDGEGREGSEGDGEGNSRSILIWRLTRNVLVSSLKKLGSRRIAAMINGEGPY